MKQQFLQELFQAHQNTKVIPSPREVCHFITSLLQIMFPELSEKNYKSFRELEMDFEKIRFQAGKILQPIEFQLPESPEIIEDKFFDQLSNIRKQLLDDANAIVAGDPAASNLQEVIRSYPGFFAIAVHRLAHQFHRLGVPIVPRILSEYAHSETGIDIHPSASIGERFCIDHGTGVVIGETVNIGNDVKIYQGVTLGALSVRKDLVQTKRHPTIEDNVVIYAGATILGGETVIGHDSVIGGNVWIVKSVPPHSRIYYKGHLQQKEEILLI